MLDVATVGTGRLSPDGTVYDHGGAGHGNQAAPPWHKRRAGRGEAPIEQVFRTGRPAHVENYDQRRRPAWQRHAQVGPAGGLLQAPSWLTGGCGAP